MHDVMLTEPLGRGQGETKLHPLPACLVSAAAAKSYSMFRLTIAAQHANVRWAKCPLETFAELVWH